jgi:hypothetical protein
MVNDDDNTQTSETGTLTKLKLKGRDKKLTMKRFRSGPFTCVGAIVSIS